MKRIDIDKVFTEKVSLFIKMGFHINTNSMCGHQGEEGKVDLIKGDELIRVWLSRESNYNFRNPDEYHGYTMILRVGRWNRPAREAMETWTTVWMRDMEVLEETPFYEIAQNHWFVETLEEALQAQRTRIEHWSNKMYQDDKIDIEGAEEIAANYLKRTQGYKRIHRDKIRVSKVIEKNPHKIVYRIFYNSNVYYLN